MPSIHHDDPARYFKALAKCGIWRPLSILSPI